MIRILLGCSVSLKVFIIGFLRNATDEKNDLNHCESIYKGGEVLKKQGCLTGAALPTTSPGRGLIVCHTG